MKTASYDYILKTVRENNILPVTSACSGGCIFCSHGNNPEGTEIFNLPSLTIEEIKGMAELLDGDKKIIIGESASRIIEGEPFIRKDMLEILKYLRKKYPSSAIEITSGGSQLDYNAVQELKKLSPIELNISLNSCTKEGRKLLHRGAWGTQAVDAVRYLKECEMPFHGSIVAMPDIVGYDDIEETAAFLSLNGALTVRIFVPGFSGLSDYKVDFISIRERLQQISDSLYELHGVPVLIEPPKINSLTPEVCGIIKGSPAAECGITKGDVILKVDDYSPLTRVDAYNRIYRSENPRTTYMRAGVTDTTTIMKKPNTASGLVFYYDIHPDTVVDIEKAVRKARSKTPLVITSELGYPILKLGLEALSSTNIDILPVDSKWFGGSIMCTGLLTSADIIQKVSEYTKEKDCDLLIVPALPFDQSGKDLSGRSFDDIENTLGIKTVMAW